MSSLVPQDVPTVSVTEAPLTAVAALLGELGAIDIAIEQLLFRREAVQTELRRMAEAPDALGYAAG